MGYFVAIRCDDVTICDVAICDVTIFDVTIG